MEILTDHVEAICCLYPNNLVLNWREEKKKKTARNWDGRARCRVEQKVMLNDEENSEKTKQKVRVNRMLIWKRGRRNLNHRKTNDFTRLFSSVGEEKKTTLSTLTKYWQGNFCQNQILREILLFSHCQSVSPGSDNHCCRVSIDRSRWKHSDLLLLIKERRKSLASLSTNSDCRNN